MSAAAIRDVGQAYVPYPSTHDVGAKHRTDAELGIKELEALRGVDMVAPPEAAAFAEPLVQDYRGNVSSGDHLRLPQLTSHDGPTLRAAIGRIVGADTTKVGGSQEDVIKEEKMRRALRALDVAVQNIQQKAAMNVRD